jgi:hypothetical protein
MTPERYAELVRIHGRRAANRAVLSEVPMNKRKLSDFYKAYGLEATLPEEERCTTGMLDKFDPTGWLNHYTDPKRALWPAPEEIVAVSDLC